MSIIFFALKSIYLLMPPRKTGKKPNSDRRSISGTSDKNQALEESFNQMQQMALEGFKAIESNLQEIQQLFTDFESRVADLSNRVNRLEKAGENTAMVPAKEGADELQKRLREAGKKIGQKIREIQGKAFVNPSA